MRRPARAHETPQLLVLPWSGGAVRHVRAQQHASDPKRPWPHDSPIPPGPGGEGDSMRRLRLIVQSGVIDGHHAFVHQFFDITIAQGMAQMPADGAENDLGFKVAPLEK
jgi:hypothetical protein